MARFFKRVKTVVQEVQRPWGTVFGEDKLETKASSSMLKGPRGQIVGFECTEAVPWSWVLARKSGLKKGLSGRERLGAKSAGRLSGS